MALFSISGRTSVLTAGSIAAEIRALSHIRVLEVGVSLAAATASTFGLGRPANTTGAGGTIITGLPIDQGTSSSGILLAGQTTAPTVPAQYLRRISLAAAIGNGVIWTFPDPIVVPAANALVLVNIAANAASDFYVVYDD